MTAADRLAELAALADAATPGPWVWHGYMESGQTLAFPNEPYHEANVLKTTDDWPPTDADAAFIAASREAVPALIAALRAVLDEHREVGSDGGCVRCASWIEGVPTPEPWPCPTVRAITSALVPTDDGISA
jgi:hypothetical protein